MSSHQEEVDKNYAVFKQLLPALVQGQQGKFALLKDGKLISVYDTFHDALNTAKSFYDDGKFSIQEIRTKPLDLGYRSRAMLRR